MGTDRESPENMSAAKWQGYASARLEDISRDVQTLEKKMDSVMWKVAGIGSAVALLTTLVINMVLK